MRRGRRSGGCCWCGVRCGRRRRRSHWCWLGSRRKGHWCHFRSRGSRWGSSRLLLDQQRDKNVNNNNNNNNSHYLRWMVIITNMSMVSFLWNEYGYLDDMSYLGRSRRHLSMWLLWW